MLSKCLLDEQSSLGPHLSRAVFLTFLRPATLGRGMFFIQQYLRSICCVPPSMLSKRDSVKSKTELSCSRGAYCPVRGTENMSEDK